MQNNVGASLWEDLLLDTLAATRAFNNHPGSYHEKKDKSHSTKWAAQRLWE